MSSKIDRRGFLTTSLTLCGTCLCSRVLALTAEDDAPIDPKALEYCGYRCPDDCPFRAATLANDEAGKRKAFQDWKLAERYGVEFDPEKAICYGCKAEGKPEGIVTGRCTVRACVREKGLDCCIECDELSSCEEDLWRRFPKFHEQVIALQKRYRAQTAA